MKGTPQVRALAGASVAVALLALVAVAGGARATAPRITAVTFAGSEARPTITIRGVALGARPSPSPAYHPPGHSLCPIQATPPLGRYGFDFGTRLFIFDRSQQPQWAAGRYRPALRELDCVGVIVLRFTPTAVVFRLGADYQDGVGSDFHLAEGDSFTVGVNGARFAGTAHYGTTSRY